jgi:hypothetical protein
MQFDALRERLLRAGVAPRHVRRYLRELDDHLADLIDAQRVAGHNEIDAAIRAQALLGGDDELAAAMLCDPRFRSWVSRAPWLVFGLVPPVGIVAAFFAAALPLVLARLYELAGHANRAAPGWFQSLAQDIALFANLVLAPGLAALLVWAACRQRLSWRWPLLGIAIVTLRGVHMSVHFPQAGLHGGRIAIIAPLLGSPRLLAPVLAAEWPTYLTQTLLTVAPALWLARKQHQAV